MPSAEERNLATLATWLNEVHANRRVELAPELLARSYTRQRPSGVETPTPESFAELAEPGILSKPPFRYEWLQVLARGARVAVLRGTEETLEFISLVDATLKSFGKPVALYEATA